MYRKTHHLVLLGTICLLCSCIDNTYDLKNKEISLDMAIEGNKIALPLGNLKPILLDSMLDIEGQEMLKEINGVYSIVHSDSIGSIGVDLGDIAIALDPMTFNKEFNFTETGVEIDEIVMPGKHEIVEFHVTDVSIEEINESLPHLRKKSELDVLHSDLIDKLGTPSFPSSIVYTKEVFTMPEQNVDVDLEYLLPKEVKNFHEIQVTNNSTRAEGAGAIVQFKITHPHILNNLEKSFSFQLKFPKSFDVSLYPEAENADNYQLADQVLTVTKMPVKDDVSYIEFYFNGFTGLDDETFYASRVGSDGLDERLFVLDDVLSYSFDYYVDGNVEVSSSVDIEDFRLGIELNAVLGLYDVIGETNPIEFDFDDECITFSTEIDELEYISEVKYVRLDPHVSQVSLTIDMPSTFAPFELNHGESFKIHLPEFLYLNEQLTTIPEGMSYDKESHTIQILDDDALDHAAVVLALDSISINKKVENGCVAMSGSARLTTGGSVFLASRKTSLRNDLPALRDKMIHFDLQETHFVVDEIVVVSETLSESLHESFPLDIYEPIEEGLGRIYSIDFKEDVSMELVLELRGIEDAKGALDLKLDVALPPFICVESDDADVVTDDGMLSIRTKYIAGETFKKSLKISRLDFTKLPQGYLAPTIDNGKPYLAYLDSVEVDATASIDRIEVSSDILTKTGEVDLAVSISPIVVGCVEGLYNGDLGKVSESFDLDLSENLAFLKDERNGLTLSEPQIMLQLENTLHVPISVDVVIAGKDENGEVIETSHIVLEDLAITPAAYDETTGSITPDSTKYLFAVREEQQMQGFTTVVVPELATLLKRIPHSVSLELVPVIDTDAVHRVDLSQPLQISGDYSVVVPLKFDDLCVSYTDTVCGLNLDMENLDEFLSNVEFSVYMDVNNTMPIGLDVELVPIDISGKCMSNLAVDPISVKAGNGAPIAASSQFEALTINAECAGNFDLRGFDGIIFNITAKANETIGGAAIKPEQGIHIKNIVVELRGDIEFDLNELDI